MKPRLALVAALSLPLTLAACNSTSTTATPPKSSAPTSAPTSAPSSAAPTLNAGDDKQRASAIQMTIADLPSGWKAGKNTTPVAKQRAEDAFYDNCLHVPVIETIQTTSSQANFDRSDGFAFVDSLINVTKTEEQAQQDLAALSGPNGVSCSISSEKKFLTPPKGSTIVDITGSRLAESTPGEFGIQTVVTLRLSSGKEVKIISDDIGLVVKRFEIQLNFTSIIQPPQTSLEQDVTAKVFARATANAA
jgi:hypothetical protein